MNSFFSFNGGGNDPLDLTGIQGANAAKSAADSIEGAAQYAANEQERQSNITEANLAPWISSGTKSLNSQLALTGASGNAAQQSAIDNLQASPGQKFLQDQKIKSMLANAAATGGLGGGNIRANLNQLGVMNAQDVFNTKYNRLAGISNTGQTTNSNLAQLGSLAANNVSGLQQQAGSARASGILGAGQAQAAGLQNAVALGAQIYGMYKNGFGGGNGATTYAAPQNSGYVYEGPN